MDKKFKEICYVFVVAINLFVRDRFIKKYCYDELEKQQKRLKRTSKINLK